MQIIADSQNKKQENVVSTNYRNKTYDATSELDKLSKHKKKICSNFAVRGFPLSRVLFFPCAFVQQVTTSDSQQKTSFSQKIESKTQRREIVFHVIAI